MPHSFAELVTAWAVFDFGLPLISCALLAYLTCRRSARAPLSFTIPAYLIMTLSSIAISLWLGPDMDYLKAWGRWYDALGLLGLVVKLAGLAILVVLGLVVLRRHRDVQRRGFPIT